MNGRGKLLNHSILKLMWYFGFLFYGAETKTFWQIITCPQEKNCKSFPDRSLGYH